MKQIIPFKKELPFKTKVSEITSISLERELEVLDDGIVSGVFHITGDYKMNEGSINREKYSFDLHFDINLDPRYDINTVNADIEDFYYDVINEDTLKVNIDLFIEAEYLPEEPKVVEEVDVTEEETDDMRTNEEEREDIVEEDIIEEEIPQMEEVKVTEVNDAQDRDDTVDIGKDLFSNLDNTETYTTYYVYIVKDDDTVEKILTKYDINKEDFENYNDINNIKAGDKVIIPKKCE